MSMVDTMSNAKSSVAAEHPRNANNAAGPKNVLRVLAVIDGSEGTGRVLQYLRDLHRYTRTIEVVLLNIQPKPQDWRLRGYGWFQREAILDRLINDLGKRAVISASRKLEGSGIVHQTRIEIGDTQDVIAQCAREEGCDFIVLPEPQKSALRLWLMRSTGIAASSLASLVTHSARLPVVLVP